MESKILSKGKINTIGRWLKESNQLGKYKLYWTSSTSKDGFINGCNGKKNTITVVRVDSGSYYYGGFTDLAWGGRGIRDSL